MLSCSCDYDYEFDPGEWAYIFSGKEDFSALDTKRGKRCCSCNALIRVGDLCIKYPRYRYPYNDIESRIKHGCALDDCFSDEPIIRIADHYQCEKCGEIYLNLSDLGYDCLLPCENMHEALAEYHEISGFNHKGDDHERPCA